MLRILVGLHVVLTISHLTFSQHFWTLVTYLADPDRDDLQYYNFAKYGVHYIMVFTNNCKFHCFSSAHHVQYNDNYACQLKIKQ